MTPLEVLAAQPRAELGHWPTPLQPADRLREAIGGPRIWLKRDDCTGLAIGGIIHDIPALVQPLHQSLAQQGLIFHDQQSHAQGSRVMAPVLALTYTV